MARMLAVVRDANDAAVAVDNGVEWIGFVLPAGDGFADAASRLRAIIDARPDRCGIGLFLESADDQSLDLAAAVLAEGRIDDVRVPLAAAARVSGRLGPGARLTGVVGLRDPFDAALFAAQATVRLDGLVLQSGGVPGENLLRTCAIAGLAEAADLCRARGLSLSFRGALEPPDVPRLLPLAPYELCFGRTLYRDGRLDARRVRLLRDLVAPPRVARFAPTPTPVLRDRIFMRDWVLPVSIGAYAREHDQPQRVRFAVEAEVERRSRKDADLRDIVSYDLITDSIRRLTSRHVELVETLAEQIAEAVLAHPRVLQVTVTVEKLDLGPGALGCRITRDKAP